MKKNLDDLTSKGLNWNFGDQDFFPKIPSTHWSSTPQTQN